MNLRQALLQIRSTMRGLVLTGTATHVFGADGSRFWVSRRIPASFLERNLAGAQDLAYGHCWAGPARHDSDDPEIVEQEISIRVYSALSHEPTEADFQLEKQWIGLDNPVGATGLLREVVGALGQLGPDSGWNSRVRIARVERAASVLQGGSFEIELIAHITTSPRFPAQRSLVAVDAVGSIDLTWVIPHDRSRYDYVGQVLRYAAGATPPANVSSGAGVDVTASAESVSVPTGAGEFSFSLWSSWDTDWPLDATADAYGDRQTATATAS